MKELLALAVLSALAVLISCTNPTAEQTACALEVINNSSQAISDACGAGVGVWVGPVHVDSSSGQVS